MSPQPNSPRSGDPRGGRPDRPVIPGTGPDRNWRWVIYVLLALLVAVIVLPQLVPTQKKNELTYNDFLAKAQAKKVDTAKVNNDSGKITGQLNDPPNTGYA